MRTMRVLAVVLSASVAASATAETPPTRWHLTDAARPAAERDYERLRDRCSDLFDRYGADIESVEIHAPATYLPANAPATAIEVRISGDARLIPATYRAWGHTLHYYVRVDGISAQKDQSWQVCGWPAPAVGHDAFHPFAGIAGDMAPDSAER